MLGGVEGWRYRIEATTNFLDWMPLADVLYSNGPITAVDPQSTNTPYRFYRGLVP